MPAYTHCQFDTWISIASSLSSSVVDLICIESASLFGHSRLFAKSGWRYRYRNDCAAIKLACAFGENVTKKECSIKGPSLQILLRTSTVAGFAPLHAGQTRLRSNPIPNRYPPAHRRLNRPVRPQTWTTTTSSISRQPQMDWSKIKLRLKGRTKTRKKTGVQAARGRGQGRRRSR